MDILGYISIGFILGALIIGIIYRSINKSAILDNAALLNDKDNLNASLTDLSSQLSVLEEKLIIEEKNSSASKIELQDRLQLINRELILKNERIIELSTELATWKSNLTNAESRLEEQKEEFNNIQKKLQTEFKNLANDILEEKSKKFTDQNKSNITDILKPLNEKIKEFEKKVDETYDKESKQRFSLESEIKKLAELNIGIKKEASDLTNALKGQSKTRGNWGEMILENILEKSGLVREREYDIQPSYTNDSGKRLQPDVVIHYPGDRNVVVDSKVSLNAFERYSSAETKEEEILAGKEHILSIRNHISDLASKNYQDLYKLNSLDFVMMFMPIEPAYLLAIELDQELWHYAYNKRILLISPTNLIASLKLVSSLWRQEKQSANVLEIARQSGELYDKFVGFLKDLEDIGKKLKSTEESYQSSINKLSSGRGNLIKRAESIKGLGARNKKNISEQLVEKSLHSDEES